MNDKYEIIIKKHIMDIQEYTKGSCNVCSITDDDRGLNITEIKFRSMTICLCDHHKNILIQKLTSDNSDSTKCPECGATQSKEIIKRCMGCGHIYDAS